MRYDNRDQNYTEKKNCDQAIKPAGKPRPSPGNDRDYALRHWSADDLLGELAIRH